MEESWKTIPISTKYEASTHGRIRRIKTGHILKLQDEGKGYLRVDIKGTCGENITRSVHRLVAITFIPNPDNEPTVNHISPDPSNNKVSNLEWASHKKQAQEARKRKLTPEEAPSSSTWGKRDIWKCDKITGDKIQMFSSVREAACEVGSSKHGMSQIFNVAENHEISNSIPGCRQGLLIAAGFKWEFDVLRVFTSETWCGLKPPGDEKVNGYEISTLGRILGPKRGVKSPVSNGQYAAHSVWGRLLPAHRLVAFTFLRKIEGKEYVNHIDGDKNNPIVDNLELCTLSENMQHAHDTGLIVRESKRIQQFDLEGNFIKEFESAKKARAEVGSCNIRGAISKSSNAGGFIWKRPSEDEDRVVKLKKPGHKCKKVKQFDLDGVFLKEYDSLREANQEVPGFHRNCLLKEGYSGGYNWRYSTDTNTTFTKKSVLFKKRNIGQYDLDMNFVAYHDSITAARVKVPGASIHWSSKNSKPSRGFYWKYA